MKRNHSLIDFDFEHSKHKMELIFKNTFFPEIKNEQNMFENIWKQMIYYFKLHVSFFGEQHETLLLEHPHLFFILLKIIYFDYIIFLPTKYFGWNIYSLLQLKYYKKLRKLFDKHYVCYFEMDEIVQIHMLLQIYNEFIRNVSEEIVKDLFQTKMIEIKDEIEEKIGTSIEYRLYGQHKFKEIYFMDSQMEIKVLYKKMRFSKQELYLNIQQYSRKKMEYRLRSFCQIAEELGSEKIEFEYSFIKESEENIKSFLKTIETDSGIELKKKEKINDTMKFTYEYPIKHIHLNLNKYHLIHKICKENQFTISKDSFESDMELKYLIQARCLNYIQRIHTEFTFENLSTDERKILLTAKKFGIELDKTFEQNRKIQLSIYIEFLPILDHLHLIDGTNVHILREGFLLMMKMLEEKSEINIYQKLNYFLKSHLYGIQNDWIDLPYSYSFKKNIIKIFNQMIEMNYKKEEWEKYIRHYFKKNISWDSFIIMRDTLLKGSETGIDKIHFITTQYFDIIYQKKNILDKIIKYLFHQNNIKIEILHLYNIDSIYYKNESSQFESRILKIILSLFKKTFKINYGLSNFQDSEKLKEIICHLVTYHFDSEIHLLYYDYIHFLQKNKIPLDLDISPKSKLENQNQNQISISYVTLYDKGSYGSYTYLYFKNEMIQYMNKCIEYISEQIQVTQIQTPSPDSFQNLMSSSTTILSDNQQILNESLENMETNIFERQKIICMKFLIRRFEHKNRMYMLYDYYRTPHKNRIQSFLLEDMDLYFPLQKCFQNYVSKRLFYVYEDYIDFEKSLIQKYKKKYIQNRKEKLGININRNINKIIKNKVDNLQMKKLNHVNPNKTDSQQDSNSVSIQKIDKMIIPFSVFSFCFTIYSYIDKYIYLNIKKICK